MYEYYLAVLLVTKKLGWCSQYSDFNMGWTALIWIFLKAKIILSFFLNIQPYSVGAPSRLFIESQQYNCWGMKLTTCLHLVPRVRMSGLLLVHPLPHAFILCRGTTSHFVPMPAPSGHHTIRQQYTGTLFDYCISREQQQLSVTATFHFQLPRKS